MSIVDNFLKFVFLHPLSLKLFKSLNSSKCFLAFGKTFISSIDSLILFLANFSCFSIRLSTVSISAKINSFITYILYRINRTINMNYIIVIKTSTTWHIADVVSYIR